MMAISRIPVATMSSLTPARSSRSIAGLMLSCILLKVKILKTTNYIMISESRKVSRLLIIKTKVSISVWIEISVKIIKCWLIKSWKYIRTIISCSKEIRLMSAKILSNQTLVTTQEIFLCSIFVWFSEIRLFSSRDLKYSGLLWTSW